MGKKKPAEGKDSKPAAEEKPGQYRVVSGSFELTSVNLGKDQHIESKDGVFNLDSAQVAALEAAGYICKSA